MRAFENVLATAVSFEHQKKKFFVFILLRLNRIKSVGVMTILKTMSDTFPFLRNPGILSWRTRIKLVNHWFNFNFYKIIKTYLNYQLGMQGGDELLREIRTRNRTWIPSF